MDVEVNVRGRRTSAVVEGIKIGATPQHLLLRFGDAAGSEVVVEVSLSAEQAARFAASVAQAVGTQAAAPSGLVVPPGAGR